MAIDRSDVCVIMIDATEGFTEQDSKVAGLAHEAGKGCVIAVNKWDAVEKDGKTMQGYRKKLEVDFSFMSYAPMVFISAKTGQRLDQLFGLIQKVANLMPCALPPACSTTCWPRPPPGCSPQRTREKAEDLLYDPGIHQAAYLCVLCEPGGPFSFFLPTLPGKQNPGDLRDGGNPYPLFDS